MSYIFTLIGLTGAGYVVFQAVEYLNQATAAFANLGLQ